jgi:hypothetical protein
MICAIGYDRKVGPARVAGAGPPCISKMVGRRPETGLVPPYNSLREAPIPALLGFAARDILRLFWMVRPFTFPPPRERTGRSQRGA